MSSDLNSPDNKSVYEYSSLPNFDPELESRLSKIVQMMNIPLTPNLIIKAREYSLASRVSDEDIMRNGNFTFEEIKIPSLNKTPDIPIIVCKPTATKGPYPVIYSIHGGGMVAGHYRTPELVSELNRAEVLQMAIVSPNYRLAPENPDPAPVEDCFKALTWLAENAASLDIDPNKIVVSGNSAGGGLAAGVSLMARDKGGPSLIGQMLQCPMLDDRCDSFTHHQMKGVGLWDSTSNLTGWSALLGNRRGGDNVSYYAAPLRANDLSGLPPAFIDVGVLEALRDDSHQYANKIWQAGGDAELHIWSGAFHSFDQWVPDANVSKAAHEARISWMCRILSRT